MKFRRFLPDLILLGAVAAAAALVMLPRMSNDSAAPAAAMAEAETSTDVTVVVRAIGLEAPSQEGIDPDALIGCPLDTGDGVIEDCHWDSYSESVWAADGVTHYSTDPTRRDLVVTLSAKMSGDPAVYTLAGQEIRAGRGFYLAVESLYLPTTIVSFERA